MRKQDLAAVARAREQLLSIDLDELARAERSDVTRAIEVFDEMFLTLSTEELAAMGMALAEDEMVVDLAEEHGGAPVDADQRVIVDDVDVDAETWEDVAEKARMLYDADFEPAMAYSIALSSRVRLVPNVVVDGEVMGLEDVEGVPLPDPEEFAEDN